MRQSNTYVWVTIWMQEILSKRKRSNNKETAVIRRQRAFGKCKWLFPDKNCFRERCHNYPLFCANPPIGSDATAEWERIRNVSSLKSLLFSSDKAQVHLHLEPEIPWWLLQVYWHASNCERWAQGQVTAHTHLFSGFVGRKLTLLQYSGKICVHL